MANCEVMNRLLQRSPESEGPDADDLPGLAWLMQSTYTEMEEVLRDIVRALGEEIPSSSSWHRDLLEQVSAPTEGRPAILSQGLQVELDQYRSFRHVARSATFPVLDWARMKPLLDGIDAVLGQFLGEVEAFLASIAPR